MNKGKVAINGFGRIGRQVFRAIQQRYKDSLEVVAVNDLADAKTMGYLLKYDSVYGRYPDTVEVHSDSIVVGGRKIRVFEERDPKKLPWRELGVQFVLESTGVFRTREGASQHFDAGAEKVIISAPASGAVDATVVLGVNESSLQASHRLISNASCSTNCVGVLLKTLNDSFGIESGMMTSIHAYTNDQKLHDEPQQKDLRRSRAAAVSLIPAATGAATDVAKVIPELTGKIDGTAVRTPNICGSIMDLTVKVRKDVTPDQVNDAFRAAARSGALKQVLEYSDEPLVSVDIIGNPASCILDSMSTMVVAKNLVKVLGWYDNEWGYSCRCSDVFHRLAEMADKKVAALAN